ncbi:1-acyl-sn-glycerol-3-phosphate acyltransferase [Candidatus Aerophobetes bacterium]|nr:1-acyl-sn-glycerol-3-phosphate acyltransferase [Candidatus Aerophobetes bacterium]
MLWILGTIVFKVLFGLKIEGEIPQKGAMVLAANHRSYLDPIVLALITSRRINFMAKQELFKNPVFAFLIGKLGAFSLRRDKLDKTAYQSALRVLEEGKILALFPEGTRSVSGKLGKLKEGSIRIALNCKVPIVPVVITGTEKVLPPGKKQITLAKIKVRVGEAVLPEDFKKRKKEVVGDTLQTLKRQMLALGANK